MLYGDQREQIRQAYIEAWRKQRDKEPLSALETLIASVIQMHPEYQPLLEARNVDYETPVGESNPFLHMGLHIAVLEQVQTDRPAGIRGIYQQLIADQGGQHAAEHAMMMCLEQVLWQANRSNTPPDEAAYLAELRKLL